MLTAIIFAVASIFPIATSDEPADTTVSVLRPEAVYKTTALGMTLNLTLFDARWNATVWRAAVKLPVKMNESADFRLTDSGVKAFGYLQGQNTQNE